MAFSFVNFAWNLFFMILSWWNNYTPSSSSSSSIPAFSLPEPVFSSAVEEFAENEDILCLILLCLPVKSLIRFKSVSKNWNRLISDYKFGINHTRRTPRQMPTSLMMLSNQYVRLLLLELDDDHQNRAQTIRAPNLDYFAAVSIPADTRLKIITSCNGLLLGHLSSDQVHPDSGYYVTNLTTRKFIRLPAPGLIISKPNVGITLAFDPSKTPHFTALCVGLSDVMSTYCDKMEIYSSETGQWRRWEGMLINQGYAQKIFSRGVLWNNAMHWLCSEGDSFYFSLVDETMKVLPLPPDNYDLYPSAKMMFLGESTGYLHLLEMEISLLNNQPIIIYQMMENHRGWIEKHRLNLDHIGRIFPASSVEGNLDESQLSDSVCSHYTFSLLSVIWAADGESLDLILWIPRHVIAYNTKYDTVKVLMRFEENIPATGERVYAIHHFIDTLSSLPPPPPPTC